MRHFQLLAKEKQAGRDWAGFEGGQAIPNPRKEEIGLEVLRRGLNVDKPFQTLAKKKSGWKGRRDRAGSASAGFQGGQAIPNPREKE